MDRFAEFVTMARDTRRKSIAPRSESTYQGYVDAYAHTMATEFQIDAFPLTEEKISAPSHGARGPIGRSRFVSTFDRHRAPELPLAGGTRSAEASDFAPLLFYQ